MIGSALLTVGIVVASLGYIGVQSVPIAVFGISVSIIGSLFLLLAPEVAQKDAYRSMLDDSVANVEILLEETRVRERAYFVPTPSNEVRAFVPMLKPQGGLLVEASSSIGSNLQSLVEGGPHRLLTSLGGLQGFVLVPPGNEIVKLSKVARGDDLEEALRSALVSFSDLARSVLLVEEEGEVKIQIGGAKLSSNLPHFNEIFGSPVSCVAACIVCAAKGTPLRLVEERFDQRLVRLRLEVVG